MIGAGLTFGIFKFNSMSVAGIHNRFILIRVDEFNGAQALDADSSRAYLMVKRHGRFEIIVDEACPYRDPAG